MYSSSNVCLMAPSQVELFKRRHASAPTVLDPDFVLVWLTFLAKAVFSLDVMPADTVGAMDAAAWQDDIACCVALGGGL